MREMKQEQQYTGIITEYESKIPAYLKYSLGIEEAARYYGIGEKKLRQIIAENPAGDFYLEIGKKILLKRSKFEAYLDASTAL